MDTDLYFLGYILPVCESTHTLTDKLEVLMGQGEQWRALIGNLQFPEAEGRAELCELAAGAIAARIEKRERRRAAIRLAAVAGVRIADSGAGAAL